ncbi:MAG: glycosyl hydrolase family 65 protein [Planctomycetota bacterium]
MIAAALALCCALIASDEPPDDFPRLTVPGHEAEMDSLRHLYWQHYRGAGPKSTLWDAWLPGPSLWPDTSEAPAFEEAWKSSLARRDVDADGYVATHQHPSIAHPRGWPFPFWNQGRGGRGWHFSFEGVPGPPWRQPNLSSPNGIALEGLEAADMEASGWRLRLLGERAVIRLPGGPLDTLQAPFLQIRWRGHGLQEARLHLSWAVGDERSRLAISPPGKALTTVVLPLYEQKAWRDAVSDLRLEIEGAGANAELVLHSLFTQYDTRHNVNSQSFILGIAKTFAWTGDVDFLRQQMPRARHAAEHLLLEHGVLEAGAVRTEWVGHDGRPGFSRDEDGRAVIHSGRGIGNNYWDLLPFGHLDTYATSLFIATAQALGELEEACAAHPSWDVPPPKRPKAFWAALTERMQRRGRELFWSEETGRFVACIDADGAPHDYGFTFVNLEAIHYGLANEEQARQILTWISGERIVEGDTSTGADIYTWRFGPRATTRRNVDWYGFFWSAPESIPRGGQVQEGGAVLGLSYFDLMARLGTRGADDVWRRLHEIVSWYDEVREAGGYREYYDGSRPGTLQGGGTAGGLGLDQEFFESVLVPQILIDGFLGLRATPEGLRIEPRLPIDWPSLAIDRIRFRGGRLRIEVDAERVIIHVERALSKAARLEVPSATPPSSRIEAGFTGMLRFER